MKIFVRCRLPLAVLYILSGQLLYGQIQSANTDPDTSATAAIAAPDIARNVEQTNRFLQASRSVLELPENLINIQQTYAAYIEQIDAVNSYVDPGQLDELTIRELSDLKRNCITYKSNLNEWVAAITEQTNKIESELAKNRRWIEIWQKTNQSAKVQNLPEDVQNTIQLTIRSLQETENEFSQQTNNLLSIQNTISSQEIILNDIITAIEKITSQKRDDLLLIDSAPLWISILDWENQPHPQAVIRSILDKHTLVLSQFYKNYRQNIVYHILTFLFLFILLTLIKKYSDKWVFQTDAVKVLSRPFSQALLISLVFGFFFYSQGPTIILVTERILIMILLLRLLPATISDRNRWLIYGFASLHFLQQLHLLSFEMTMIQRLYMLFLSVLALILIIRMLQYYNRNVITIDNRLFTLFVGLMRITIGILIIAIISNIIGNVSLTEQLNYGVMTSIFAAIGLTISVHILNALFITLLYSRYANYLRIVQKKRDTIEQTLSRILKTIAVLFWASLVLNGYGLYEPLFDLAVAIFNIRFTLGSFEISPGDILLIALTIWLSYWISKFIRFILEGDVLSRIKLPRGVPATISKLSHYLILGFGVMIALSMAGFDLTKFAFIAGALGVGIGFGLQNVVNNFVSGLILVFERPIQIGDVVELENLLGVVKKIGIRASMIRTFAGAEVIVPNGNLISNTVINWTLSDKFRRIEISVGVAYGTDPVKVLALLKELTTDHEDILKKPEPQVLFMGFGESSLDFELRFWTTNFETWLIIKSELTLAVHEALKKANIEIPFPQRDLHVKSARGLTNLQFPDGKTTATKKNPGKKNGTPDK